MSKHSKGRRSAPRPEEERAESAEATAPYGPRSARLKKRQRRGVLLRVGAGIVTGALAAAIAIGLSPLGDDPAGPGDDRSARGGAGARAAPTTTLVFGTRETDAGDPDVALWLMIFNYDPQQREGAAVHVPAHTAVEVPGRGLESLEGAYRSGGIPLLLVSLENLLGIEVDRYLELSDKDARVLFAGIGPITVDVPEDVSVPAGAEQVRLVFPAGSQELKGAELVRLLYTRGSDVDDVDFGTRQLAFWDGLFDRFDNEPGALARAVDDAGAALGESDAEAADHARFFAQLAGLPRVAFTITALPVSPVAAGRDEMYAADSQTISDFVATNFEASKPEANEVRVQILNGNGVPGIGQEVAERLVGEGYRVILSGNARHLDYRRTLIVTYDDSAEGEALAERAKRLLGVGEIQISTNQQGIVDLTIVVGEDFLTTL